MGQVSPPKRMPAKARGRWWDAGRKLAGEQPKVEDGLLLSALSSSRRCPEDAAQPNLRAMPCPAQQAGGPSATAEVLPCCRAEQADAAGG